MSRLFAFLFAVCLTACAFASEFRPPSVPLVVHDPYFSIWSPADKLTDADTVHWTGRKHPLHAMICIDGKTYRLMGAEPKDVPAMEQKSVEVGPLTTKYVFENEIAQVTLSFTTPFLPNDLKLISLPAVLVDLTYESKDGKEHDLDIYFDAGAEIAVNTPDQSVACSEWTSPNRMFKYLSVGSTQQNVLGKRGDDVRIDWGYFLFSVLNTTTENSGKSLVPLAELQFFSPYHGEIARNTFARTGSLQMKLPPFPDQKEYRVDELQLTLVAHWSMKEVKQLEAHPIVLAYNDVLSVRYFGEDLPSYSSFVTQKELENFPSLSANFALIVSSWMTFGSLKFRSDVKIFEQEFMTDLTAVGGEDYARLCALAYRQVFGANKVVADANGMPLMFSKENFSNGCMGTIDVMYPCSPMLLYYSPALMKATLQPVFAYAESERWPFPFAPHDLGTYPHATGQVYGGGERTEENQMPVEESANMIIQTAALAVAEQKPDFAKLHWDTLTQWADYLLEKGFDPENQLCTDDFAGHLAHNVNLSAKAIVALAAYAQLAEKLGKDDVAKKYRNAAEEFVQRWIKEAQENETGGDHFRLAFDKPGTWSMKYNLMWDDVLELNLFPKEVMRKEIAYYKTKMQKFGLPLDNRSLYTKNDWIIWIATMCENRNDFDAFVKPIIGFVNNSPQRVPLSDWYFTDTANVRGFQARSVVGGYFAPMLKNRTKWLEQAARGADVSGDWAPITLPGKPILTVAQTAEEGKVLWRYTFEKPGDGWEQPEFDDSAWKEGAAGFGTHGTPGAIIGTEWNTDNIWLRREFEWNGDKPENAVYALNLHHDEDVEVYLNGVKVFDQPGWITSYDVFNVTRLQEVLRKGKNRFAVHCKQTDGGQYIDVGIVLIEKK